MFDALVKRLNEALVGDTHPDDLFIGISLAIDMGCALARGSREKRCAGYLWL